ncbi:hypothetical protein V6N11_071449 [Hibiscus sabdariffa]|uniref:Reverse transcriptase zinc-binding domain-containing protein n=1 Tax=Hibiscus sabdariffa TaxID=183260 RepID=A0ABR2U039_9ROSI
MCMQLPRHPQADMYIWRANKLGQYSVRNGYKLLCGEDLDPTGEPNLLQYVSANIYNTLQSLKLPAKIKITWWRTFNNFLLTAVNLHNITLNVHLNCCLCESASESVLHLLFECPFSAQVLSALHITLPTVSDEHQWLQWLSHLFDCLLKEVRRSYFSRKYFPSSYVPSLEIAEAHVCNKAVSLPRDMSETFGLTNNVKRSKMGFEAISFNHVNRRQNEVIHVLAKEGWHFAYQRGWIEEAPDVVVAAAKKYYWWVDPPL